MKTPAVQIEATKRHRMFKTLAASAALLVVSANLCLPPALAKSQAVEVLKYLNPIPEKKSYLNESQDRLIKKKSFKAATLPDGDPVANKEIGLFAVVSPEQTSDSALLDQLLSRADVNGLSVLLTWQQLEPVEEEFNWAPVDSLLDAAKKYNKSLILRVSTAGVDSAESDTPKWVFDAGVKSLSYTGADGKPHLMPIFWDSNYLAKWSNFIKEMGERYDKNPQIHSIGITGGGIRGGTAVVPNLAPAAEKDDEKAAQPKLEDVLKKDHAMSPRQLVEHWKYVADLFPQAFPTARLNFDISAPIKGRAGQDTLDEISDYLVYRYGQRVYLTRQNVSNAKHGFDQYRVLLKFRPDTYTGYQITTVLPAEDMEKLAKFGLDDGITFVELPVGMLTSTDEALKKPLQRLASHLGYQIISQKAAVEPQVESGKPLKASFTFVNRGAATPMRPNRNFDKDVAGSFKVQIELRDSTGKPIVQSLHTPSVPTHQWTAGIPVTWEEELKMPKLQPGDYTVWMSMIDPESKRKINFLNALTDKKASPEEVASLGTLKVLPDRSLGSTTEASTPSK